jgi:hypothetical protein
MKDYVKPSVELVDFNIFENIMDDPDDIIPDMSGGVEDW